jgi:hypothetical protein
MQRQSQAPRRSKPSGIRQMILPCALTALILFASAAFPAGAQQPRFAQGFQGAPQPEPPDPSETAAYAAALNEPDLNARITAIQQFLADYPNSRMRQAALSQIMVARRQREANLRTVPNMARPAIAQPPPAVTVPAMSNPSTVGMALPDSLLQKAPKPAEITIAAHKLAIKADNSTLAQILQSISSSTGMKIEGLSSGKDDRIFGSYGPGDPHEVLLALLDGSGYNVIMVGETATGAPRELSLSQRGNSTTQAASQRSNSGEDDADDDQEVQQVPSPGEPGIPVQGQPGAPPGESQPPPRNPQEILQELQRLRQQGQQPGQQPQPQ